MGLCLIPRLGSVYVLNHCEHALSTSSFVFFLSLSDLFYFNLETCSSVQCGSRMLSKRILRPLVFHALGICYSIKSPFLASSW